MNIDIAIFEVHISNLAQSSNQELPPSSTGSFTKKESLQVFHYKAAFILY